MASKKLGSDQMAVLGELNAYNNGKWSPGCGWYWGTISLTVKVLEGLTRRGLVKKISDAWEHPGEFEITQAGRDMAPSAQRK
jgi:hypothetical protein